MQNTKGFTLLELSIVIVIIGLIVAGISAGQSLVQQANLRQTISYLKEFDTSLASFKLQYDALPGDMINANDYWSDATSGNGNGQVRCNTTGDECWRLWMHLDSQHAGLFPGIFNGNNEAPTDAMGLVQMPTVNYDSYLTVLGNKNLLLGWLNATGPIAQSLDLKVDDGVPTRGRMITVPVFLSSNDCVKQDDGTTNAANSYTGIGIYNVQQTSEVCSVHYIPTIQN